MNQQQAKTQLRDYIQQNKEKYLRLHDSLEKYRMRLEKTIENALRNVEIATEVSSRIKDWEKIEPKLEEGHTVLQINDLIGLRVITMYEDDVLKLSRMLAPFFCSRPQKRRWSSSTGRKAGYSGVHVQVKLSALGGIKKELHAITVELQIRTHLQHVWAELSHKEFYKSRDGVPYNVQDRLFRLAASLDVLSDEIVAIRDELKNQTNSISQQVLNRFDAHWRQTSIDEFTLSVAGNQRLNDQLLKLREIAVIGGFRESAWPESVRVGLETDIFVPFAHLHDLETIGEFETLINEAFRYEAQIVEVGRMMKERHGENHNLFARPLFILAVVLMLRNPARPCNALAETIVRVVQELTARINPSRLEAETCDTESLEPELL